MTTQLYSDVAVENQDWYWPTSKLAKPILNVGFQDFWDEDKVIWEHYFKTSHCFLWEKWDVRYNPEQADVVFCSIFRRPPEKSMPDAAPRVLLIHEPVDVVPFPEMDVYKGIISFTSEDPSMPNNHRVPYWVYRTFDQYASHIVDIEAKAKMLHRTELKDMGIYSYEQYMKSTYLDFKPVSLIDDRTKFCAFMQGKSVEWRDEVFRWLNEYKRVDSGGPLFFNLSDGELDDEAEATYMKQKLMGRAANVQKADFFSRRRFGICMENTMDMVGYTTEKIIDAYFAGCIPLYGGQMDPSDGFNPKAFINLYDYDSKDNYMKSVIYADKSGEVEMLYRSAPLFTSYPEKFTLDALLDLYKGFFE